MGVDPVMSAFADWFQEVTGYPPHGWQERLGTDSRCVDRLVRIPTGLGKTAGVVAAWAWNGIVRADDSWPRRLAFCLPMRVLVEQTEAAIRQWLERGGMLWKGGAETHRGKVGVHVLMGGIDAGEWHLYPDEHAVLIGTQDMLLSRGLNRGYGAARARWPMEFALLHSDCLWVLDEVQLMDVGLATSAQLQAFRQEDGDRCLRPVRSWWMSATLQPDWLGAASDFAPLVTELPRTEVMPAERTGSLWTVEKSVEVAAIPRTADEDCTRWAVLVAEAHRSACDGVTLAIANTVSSACALYEQLRSALGASTDVRLVHSRFRGIERSAWRQSFLSRDACAPGANRVIVATQVVEAGVDVSAAVLVTEMAPWPSLVQRFGRCARYGGSGRIIVVDRYHDDASAGAISVKKESDRSAKRRADDEDTARPYAYADVSAAADAVRNLSAADPGQLERFESTLQAVERARLFPYEPAHVLTRQELEDLFDTGPDLTGADLDVSRFVRSGEERDLSVWWWPVEGDVPPADLHPARSALCPVPVGEARNWLEAKSGDGAGRRIRAWVWDYLQDAWRALLSRDIYPGQTILVDAAEGGYRVDVGFTGKRSGQKTTPIPIEGTCAAVPDALRADLAQDQDDLSIAAFKTIATHGAEAGEMARNLGAKLGLDGTLVEILDLAARAHDLGKSHPVFAAAIRDKQPFEGRVDLAKAPSDRWHAWQHAYEHSPQHGKRRGFRHELASALALFELLRRVAPDHPALAVPDRAILETAGISPAVPEGNTVEPVGFLAELSRLDADAFDLVVWLVCTHHGKVRASWQSSPSDQSFEDEDGRGLPLRGVREKDVLPPVELCDRAGARVALPPVELHLDPAAIGLSARYGPSWADRVARLLRRWGPFTLSYLEALLRVADVRASRLATADPVLSGRHA